MKELLADFQVITDLKLVGQKQRLLMSPYVFLHRQFNFLGWYDFSDKLLINFYRTHDE